MFPKLTELSLLSDEELAHWPNTLESYGSVLRRLKNLQLLEWNYYDGDDEINVYSNWDVVTEERLAEIVLILAYNCANLKGVNFCLVVDGVKSLAILRDNDGHTGLSAAAYSDSLLPNHLKLSHSLSFLPSYMNNGLVKICIHHPWTLYTS